MSCSCGNTGFWGNGCCPSCQPSNVAIRGGCTDPGTITSARFLVGLDPQFCHGRITNGPGVLNNIVNGSGNSVISWSNTPKIDPESVQGVEDQSFGNFLILSSDSRMRQLIAPAVAGLTVQTNATGQFIIGAPPAATIPDPLEVSDLVVSDQATIDKLEVNGEVELNGLVAGTAVNILGFDAANKVVLTALGQGLGISTFFESPTSPSASTPNLNKNSGEYLVIGNRLFDSGQDNIAVGTSESLTIQDAGNYLIMWQAQSRMAGGAGTLCGVWLELNGTVVNYGNGRTTSITTINTTNGSMWQLGGMDVRAYAANTTIKLLLNATTTDIQTCEVRLVAVRIP